MIKIIFLHNSNQEVEFVSIKGHANSAPYPHDLVCAGVSAITLGAINALENDKDFEIVVKEGRVEIKVIKKPTLHDQIVLSVLESQLQSLASSYKENIRLERKSS